MKGEKGRLEEEVQRRVFSYAPVPMSLGLNLLKIARGIRNYASAISASM